MNRDITGDEARAPGDGRFGVTPSAEVGVASPPEDLMNRRVVVLLSLSIPASGAFGCRKVMDLVHGLTGGGEQPATPGAPPPGTPGAPAAPAPAPAAGSSVRTPAPSRAGGCPATAPATALLPGTVHDTTVQRDETWTLEDSPHRLPDGVEVHDGATLTIAPCAVVLVGNGHGVFVRDGGGLSAAGDAQRPVRFGSNNPQPQAGDWQGVWVSANARRNQRLSYVVMEHGGADWEGRTACLEVAAVGLHVDHLTARACRGFGVALVDNGTFSPDSSDLTVTGTVAGNAPLTGAVYVHRAPSVGSLPAGAYTGNAQDEVFIAEAGAGSDLTTIRQTTTWRNPGVPYHLADNSDLRVDGPTAPVLTIAPGTTLRFGRGSGLSVGYDAEGGLVLDGGGDATRITLRSAGTDESPGLWHGVYLGARFNRTVTRLRYVTLRNAGEAWNGQLCDWEGGGADNPFVMFEAAPNAGSVEHLAFAGGAPDGVAIGRRWNGAPFDFNAPALGNDFAQFGAGCHQSPIADASGACPDPAPACN
jgi:hypothetical protein